MEMFNPTREPDVSSLAGEGAKEKEGEKPPEKAAGMKSVLTRVRQLAQRYLLDGKGWQKAEEKTGQAQTRSRPLSPAPSRGRRSRTSLTQAQIRSRRRSQQRGGAQQPALAVDGGSDGVATPGTGGEATGKTNRSEQSFRRVAGSAGKAAARRSSHHPVVPMRVKSLRLLRSCRKAAHQTPPSSSVLPSSLRSSTLPPSSAPPSSREEQGDTARTALIKELSSRHQSSLPLCGARESTLI